MVGGGVMDSEMLFPEEIKKLLYRLQDLNEINGFYIAWATAKSTILKPGITKISPILTLKFFKGFFKNGFIFITQKRAHY